MDSVEEEFTQGGMTRAVESGSCRVIGALKDAAALLPPEELTELLKTAFRYRNAIDAALSHAVGSLDCATRNVPDRKLTQGLDAHEWLSSTLQITLSAAYAQVQLAREMPKLPGVACAFAVGEISSQHASVVARCVKAVERAGGPRKEAETRLLEEARGRDPRDLFKWGLGLVHELVPHELEDEEERQRDRRCLRLEEAFRGGYEIGGYLDPVGGATLKAALNGLLGPRPKDDLRSHAQRRADGLVELARRALDSGELPVRGGVRPHITVTATLDTLLGNPGAPTALLDWGWPISGKALRHIAQDAEITPILLNEKGDPLRVGRKYRTATPKMRAALAERDRGCVWPGCDRPPEWSQKHHEIPWAENGPTDVDYMSLLCSRHHPLVSRGWTVERRTDRKVEVCPPPDWFGASGFANHGPP
jgi:hypothetical protein